MIYFTAIMAVFYGLTNPAALVYVDDNNFKLAFDESTLETSKFCHKLDEDQYEIYGDDVKWEVISCYYVSRIPTPKHKGDAKLYGLKIK